VPSEGFNALTAANVPEFAGAVNTPREAIVSSEVKLPTGKFSCVTFKSEYALTSANIPHFGCIIEGSCQQFITICIETQTDNLSSMPT